MKATILIVEDEIDLLELLEYRLQKDDYETLGFVNTKNVRKALDEEKVDLIIMDRNLPDIEGSEFIAMLRDFGMNTPVIFLSAKDSNYQIKEGFLRGCDDYITKPFDFDILLLRIAAILKRLNSSNIIETQIYKDIKIDHNSRQVEVDKENIELTKLEFDLLSLLIKNQNKVLKRDDLLEIIWGKDSSYQGRTVNVAINRLKEKIDPLKEKEYIKTIRGVGYSLY